MAEALTAASESREIRVFLSSTFRDFMEERDLLVKQVFPELRRKARERGVEVVDLDLRWGITEEESRQGKVIPICLGEIDRCSAQFRGASYPSARKDDASPSRPLSPPGGLMELSDASLQRGHQG